MVMTPPTSTLIFCSRFELPDLDQSAGQALDPVFLVNDLCLDLAPQKKKVGPLGDRGGHSVGTIAKCCCPATVEVAKEGGAEALHTRWRDTRQPPAKGVFGNKVALWGDVVTDPVHTGGGKHGFVKRGSLVKEQPIMKDRKV